MHKPFPYLISHISSSLSPLGSRKLPIAIGTGWGVKHRGKNGMRLAACSTRRKTKRRGDGETREWGVRGWVFTQSAYRSVITLL